MESKDKTKRSYTKHLKEQREFPDYLIETLTSFIIGQLPIVRRIVDEYYTNEYFSKDSWNDLKNLCLSAYNHDNGDIKFLCVEQEKVEKCKYLSNKKGSTLYNVREGMRFKFIKNFLEKYDSINESTKKPEQYKTMIMVNIISHIYYLLTETEK